MNKFCARKWYETIENQKYFVRFSSWWYLDFFFFASRKYEKEETMFLMDFAQTWLKSLFSRYHLSKKNCVPTRISFSVYVAYMSQGLFFSSKIMIDEEKYKKGYQKIVKIKRFFGALKGANDFSKYPLFTLYHLNLIWSHFCFFYTFVSSWISAFLGNLRKLDSLSSFDPPRTSKHDKCLI